MSVCRGLIESNPNSGCMDNNNVYWVSNKIEAKTGVNVNVNVDIESQSGNGYSSDPYPYPNPPPSAVELQWICGVIDGGIKRWQIDKLKWVSE